MQPGTSMLTAMLAVGALSGCAVGAPSERPTAESIAAALSERSNRAPLRRPSTAGASVADLAVQMVGIPYRYGGMDPQNGFDCSGLVYYTHTQTGIRVPRTSQAQYEAARKLSLDRAVAGDLVFFRDQQKLSHVGIYLGDGSFVHAPTSGRSVSIAELDNPYYRQHLVAVGRLVPD